MEIVLRIQNLHKKYTAKEAYAVRNVNLEVEKGELLALVGESGSGKTTLLRLIAGFEQVDKGEIYINEQLVADEKTFISPEKRKVGMVFQDYALFPHLTIDDNIAYGLHGMPREQRKQRIEEVKKLVGLLSFGKRFPHELSGGQQQRAAIARSLAPNPSILLLDEPFSNLDGVLKDQVRQEIRQIIKKSGTTAVFVTHDTRDALSTADRIAILKDGGIQQISQPEEIYNHPHNIYVANFFGKVNVFNALATSNGFESNLGFIPTSKSIGHEGKVVVAVRPEHILLCSSGQSTLSGSVENITYLGDHKQLQLLSEKAEKRQRLLIKVPVDTPVELHAHVHFCIKDSFIQVLDTCWYPALGAH